MDPFIGEIKLVPFNFAPDGWAFCFGQLLSIAQNTALFSLLGTTYGGNGQTTFALPDLRGRVIVGPGQGAGLSSYDLGQVAGQENVSLIQTQIPAHNHLVQVSTALGTTPSPTLASPARSPLALGNVYGTGSPVAMDAASLQPRGAGTGHENRQPFLVLNYIIAMEGIFPARS